MTSCNGVPLSPGGISFNYTSYQNSDENACNAMQNMADLDLPQTRHVVNRLAIEALTVLIAKRLTTRFVCGRFRI